MLKAPHQSTLCIVLAKMEQPMAQPPELPQQAHPLGQLGQLTITLIKSTQQARWLPISAPMFMHSQMERMQQCAIVTQSARLIEKITPPKQ